MSVERDIRFELLARLCPNSTGKLMLFIFLDNFVDTSSALVVSVEFVYPFLSKALRFAVFAQRQACLLSEHVEKLQPRKTS